jgi:hypothetical protein
MPGFSVKAGLSVQSMFLLELIPPILLHACDRTGRSNFQKEHIDRGTINGKRNNNKNSVRILVSFQDQNFKDLIMAS